MENSSFLGGEERNKPVEFQVLYVVYAGLMALVFMVVSGNLVNLFAFLVQLLNFSCFTCPSGFIQ